MFGKLLEKLKDSLCKYPKLVFNFFINLNVIDSGSFNKLKFKPHKQEIKIIKTYGLKIGKK